MAKRRLDRRLTKTSRDPVTGEYETVQLDAVRAARERVRACLERELGALDAAGGYRLADEVEELLRAMRPHTGGEGVVFGADDGEAA